MVRHAMAKNPLFRYTMSSTRECGRTSTKLRGMVGDHQQARAHASHNWFPRATAVWWQCDSGTEPARLPLRNALGLEGSDRSGHQGEGRASP
jgi:hypothetical protein